MNKKPKVINMKAVNSLNALSAAKTDVESHIRRFLQEMGWHYNCEIHSVWLWKKEIDGKMVYVNESTALWISEKEIPWPYEGQAEHPDGYDGVCACDSCMSYG